MKTKSILIIPKEVEPLLLPSPHLSILELLRFRIPNAASNALISRWKTEDFFSDKPPITFTPQLIAQIPSPPKDLVKNLRNFIGEATSNGMKSVKCPHSRLGAEKTYPLWIITYWAKLDGVQHIRDSWEQAEWYLQDRLHDWTQRSISEGVSVIKRIMIGLSSLQWADSLRGFSKEAVDSLDTLTRYASTQWMTGENANQLLDLLHNDLERRGQERVKVASTYFYSKISLAFDEREGYGTNQTYRTHRQIGEDLENGAINQLAFLANLDRNHWIAVIIDAQTRRIYFGDSLGLEISKAVWDVLDWWTGFHNSGEPFTLERLPITIQQDSFSCGVLAWNALSAFLTDVDLIPITKVTEGRMRALLEIIDEHMEAIVEVCVHKELLIRVHADKGSRMKKWMLT